jgi:TolB protein
MKYLGQTILFVFLATSAILTGDSLPAQDEEWRDIISETGATRVNLALPEFRSMPRGSVLAHRAAQTIQEVLHEDLLFSGFFEIVNPDYYRLVNSFSEADPKYREWTMIGADSLILGHAEENGEKIVVEGRLYEVPGEMLMLGKRYRGGVGSLRSIAHRFADEVVLQYTGERGVASSRIAFVHQKGDQKEIFFMDYDGEHRSQLTRDGSLNLTPSWSSDGSRIAFVSYRRDYPELVLLSQDGTRVRAFPQSGELNSAPDWSPDGERLAFNSSRDGNAEIYILRVRDGRLTRLTNNAAIDSAPAWAPNGRELLFTSDRSGTPQIYVMDADGTNVRRLTFKGNYNDQGAWSPVGDRIAFTSRLEGRFEIFRYDLNEQRAVRLTSGRGNKESPSWSPDGRHLAFSSNNTGRYEIYTMDATGGAVRRITREGGNTSPDWSR